MSIVPASVASKARSAAGPHEVRVYMHSWLLYWWAVWLAGYLMAA